MDDPWKAKTKADLEERASIKVPEEVSDFLGGVKNKKWLSGGKRADWEEVEKIVAEWRTQSLRYFPNIPEKIERKSTFKGTLQRYKANNLTLATSSSYYKKVFPDMNSFRIVPEYVAQESEKNLAARLVQITIGARVHEINSRIDSIAEVEYRVLEKGGIILGFDKKAILVYFPFSSEVVLKKLKDRKL